MIQNDALPDEAALAVARRKGVEADHDPVPVHVPLIEIAWKEAARAAGAQYRRLRTS
jgi:hypothetical protein